MMKRIVAIILAFVLIMATCSCGATESNSGSQSASEKAPTETVSSEAAPTETVSSEAAPTETVSSEAAPAETASSETTPSETASSESALTETEKSPAENVPGTASAEPEAGEEQQDEMDELSALGDVQVENGILTVSITLPADLAQGMTQEQLDASKGTTYLDAVLNDDGSVTYKMTKAQHRVLLEQLTASFDQSIQEMIDDNETYSISAVTHNDDYTIFDVSLDGTELGFGDTISSLLFYMCGGMYGVFNGHRPEHVIVNFYDPNGKLIESGDSANMAQ